MLNSFNATTLRRLSAFVNSAIVLAVLLAVLITFNWPHMPGGIGDFLAIRITIKNILVSLVCLVGGATAFHLFGLTKPASGISIRRELGMVIKACTVASAFALLFPLTSRTSTFTQRIAFYFLPAAITACFIGRLVTRRFAERLVRSLNGRRNVLIVGAGSTAQRLYEGIQRSHPNDCHVLGFVESLADHPISETIRTQLLGGFEELEDIIMRQTVDEVVIALPADSCYAQIQSAITTCERAGVEAKYLFSNIFELSLAKPRLEAGEDASIISFKVVQDDARLVVKRAIDIAGALVAITLLGPLMFLLAGAIRCTSPGPVLFVQERYGLRKRKFRMLKFRTMVRDAEILQASLESFNEVQGPVFKIRKDPRITPLGRLLRKTSLDELPQFVNVLRGEMSLVGPRPLPIRDVSKFDNLALMRRFSVKPGLTCLWQINGRSETNFAHWIELDLRYIDTWSLSLDLEILAKTFPSVLAGRGAV